MALIFKNSDTISQKRCHVYKCNCTNIKNVNIFTQQNRTSVQKSCALPCVTSSSEFVSHNKLRIIRYAKMFFVVADFTKENPMLIH